MVGAALVSAFVAERRCCRWPAEAGVPQTRQSRRECRIPSDAGAAGLAAQKSLLQGTKLGRGRGAEFVAQPRAYVFIDANRFGAVSAGDEDLH